ncbi:CRISPR-associated protein Cas4 [Candidatus Bathyarchaeota archaeon]|nr:CRISPR-associated protein Cas4 [Candidatus Bathyarchaeota archaeon]
MEEEYLTAVDVKHYAYCPRIVYFTHVLHLQERTTEAMLYGSESHDESVIAPVAARLRASKIIRDLELVSDRLKLRGKLDYLIVTKFNELIPVEVKWTEPIGEAVKRDHRLQLASYALMVEENFGRTVKRAVVYYTRAKKLLSTPLDEDIKNEAKRTLKSIFHMISEEELPKAVKHKRCINCGFKDYCKPLV